MTRLPPRSTLFPYTTLFRSVEECDRTAPRDAATLRVHAQWCEVQGQWSQAIEHWLESINREPSNSYGYRQLWDCMARSAADQRKQLWQKMSAMLLSYAGRLTAARETMVLAAQRFGIAETEVTLSLWRDSRPDGSRGRRSLRRHFA